MKKKFRQTKIKKNLEKRALIIQLIRTFFINNNFLEVETPVRIPAPAPEAYIDAMHSENWYLQTSPELCMKELLSAGYSNIFQICKCFRKNERGTKHIPELTMLEWYCKDSDYNTLMTQCEKLLNFICEKMKNNKLIKYQENKIDIALPWEKISVKKAFIKYSSTSMEEALKNDCFDEIMSFEIEPKLGFYRPVFLYDYPAEKASLSKLKNNDKTTAQRFELYIAGIELCNGFTELTDSMEQRKRFQNEIELMKKNGKKTYPMPEKFLAILKSMPDAAGIAFGIDRLVMLLTNSNKIDDVVAFTPEDL